MMVAITGSSRPCSGAQGLLSELWRLRAHVARRTCGCPHFMMFSTEPPEKKGMATHKFCDERHSGTGHTGRFAQRDCAGRRWVQRKASRTGPSTKEQ